MKNSKKVLSLSLAATMLGSATTAFAMPADTVVIGDKAFEMAALSSDNAELQAEINAAILDADAIYYNIDGVTEGFLNADGDVAMTTEAETALKNVVLTKADGTKETFANFTDESGTVVEQADLTAYTAALAKVTEADYTAASWTTYQAVVTANVVTVSNTQAEVDAATAAITAAQANLVSVNGLAVESVSAINNKTIIVTLNRAYDKTNDKFEVYLTTDVNAKITMTATAVEGNAMQVLLVGTDTAGKGDLLSTKNYTVKLKNGTDEATKAFDVATDVSVPQLTFVEVVGNRILKAKFSEPVYNLDANKGAAGYESNFQYRAKGTTVWTNIAEQTKAGSDNTQAKFTVSNDLKMVTIELDAALSLGDYEFGIDTATSGNPLADYSANTYAVPATTKAFTVDAATTVAQPTGVTVGSRTEVTVAFDSPVLALTAEQTKLSAKVGATTVTSTGVTTVDSTHLKYTFASTPSGSIPVGTAEFTVGSVTDANGNATPSMKFTAEVTDSTAVTTTAAQNGSVQTSVKVTFNKAMTDGTGTGGAEVKTAYEVTQADGTKVVPTTVAYTEPVVGGKTVYQAILTFAKDIPAGTHSVKIVGIKDSLGTVIAEASASLIMADKTAPAYASYVAKAGEVVVTFNEAMAISGEHSILNASNYQIDLTGGGTFTALPTGTVLAAQNDNKSVSIKLPTGSTITNGAGDLKVGHDTASTLYRVADATGNLLSSTSVNNMAYTAQIDVDNATAFKVMSTSTVEITLNKALQTVVADDFKVTKTSKTSFATAELVPVAASVDSTGMKVTLTFADGTFVSSNVAGTTVRAFLDPVVANVSTVDALGNKLMQTTVTGFNLTANKIAAGMTSVQATASNKVVVTFDGNVSSAQTAALQGALIIVQGSTTLSNADLNSFANITANKVEITLAGGKVIDPTTVLTVKTVAQDYIAAKDSNGNYLKANTTGIESATTFMAQSVDVVMGDNTTAAKASFESADDKIELVFNKILDTASIVSTWDGSSALNVEIVIGTDGTMKVTKRDDKTTEYNVGTLSGFSVFNASADIELDGTLTYNAVTKTLTITPAATLLPTNGIVVANGDITFTADSDLKTTGAEAITTTVKPAVAEDSAPVLVSAAVNYANAGATDWGTNVGDDLVLTFSEPVYAGAGWTDAAPVFGELSNAFTFSGGQPGDGTFTSTSIDTVGEATNIITVSVAGAVTNKLDAAETIAGKAAVITDVAGNTQVVGSAVTPTYTSK